MADKILGIKIDGVKLEHPFAVRRQIEEDTLKIQNNNTCVQNYSAWFQFKPLTVILSVISIFDILATTYPEFGFVKMVFWGSILYLALTFESDAYGKYVSSQWSEVITPCCNFSLPDNIKTCINKIKRNFPKASFSVLAKNCDIANDSSIPPKLYFVKVKIGSETFFLKS